MKKLFAVIALFVAVFAAFLFGSNIVAVHAEIGDDETIISEEPINETKAPTEETVSIDQEKDGYDYNAIIASLQERVDELLEYINEQEEVRWFTTFIASPLVGGVLGVLAFLIGLIPWIQKSQRYKALQAAASQLSDDFEEYKKENSTEKLKKILVDTVAVEIKKHFDELRVEIKKHFDELRKDVNIDKGVMADSNATNKAIYQLLLALVDGAKIAWGGDADARKALNVQPTAETVKATEETNLKLVQYIAKTEGQAAVEKALKG